VIWHNGGLLGKWDDRTHEALFGKRAAAERVDRKAESARLHARYGACSRKAYSHTSRSETFTVACDDGDLRLTLSLDAEGHVALHSWKPLPSETACPVKR
jgi:hypothetical protein